MMTHHRNTRVGAIVFAAACGLASLLLAASGSLAHQEGGDPLTDAQQKCANGALKDWGKSSKISDKTNQACLKNYAKGKPFDAANPAIDTLEECLDNDPKGKVQKQKDKTSANFDKNCGGPLRDGVDSEGFPVMPPEYGATDPLTVSAAAGQQQGDIVHDVFGANLDGGVMVADSDSGDARDAAKCQQSVMKTVSKCVATREKEFLKCTKTHLKGPGVYGLIYDIEDLALCYDGIDPFKIMKKCAGVPGQGMQKKVQKCADTVDDRSLSQLFPGCASDNVSGVTVCLDQAAKCRFCLSANSAVEANRDCDLFDDDIANGSCELCAVAEEFSSTMEAIQAIIFDSPTYGCSSELCHGASSQGGLNLEDDPNTPVIESHANLINVAGQGASPPLVRVFPGEQDLSFLYNKLAAGVDPNQPTGGGSPMPSGGAPALTPEHLEAMKTWIRGGAPEDLTVDGTALLLGSCLPGANALTIPVPDPPGANVGVQFQQTPWPLPLQSEDEICMATYYDLTNTGLVPASAIVTCPYASVNNPGNQCFLYHKQSLFQDPQSHHSIIHLYTGTYGVTDPGWGSFTYKFQDQSNPLEGTACDPLAVGSEGYNPGCSGGVVSTIACIGYGPPDYSQGGGGGGGSTGTAPTFSGSQEPYYEVEYADGVYAFLPMRGTIVWNGHAFNLTDDNSTMSQYLNLDFAAPADQLYPVAAIFDAASIFVQDVPPFETREYCRTYTIPDGASLFQLSSHTHKWGVQWRTWGPPNTVCVPGEPACVPRGDLPLYLSTDYSDPLQLFFDPPITHTPGASVEDRSYLFCSVYDNGSGPGSPSVKRQSTTPEPPLPLQLGGPCDNDETACIDGPNKGVLCNANDSFCDSSPGAGDGDCDACPVEGGVTTGDEMFILIGSYFIP